MLLYDNLPTEFYQKILNASNQYSRVLLIATLDVDSLCACRILHELFSCDNIQSSIIPVANDNQLYDAYHLHKSDHQFVIFLNCGGNLDLTEALLDNEIEDDDIENHDIEIYILDSRRPLDLVNVYTAKPIFVILKQEDEISLDFDFIPKLDQIYRDEEDEDEIDFDKEEWMDAREKLLRNYSRTAFYSTSASYTVFDIAWRMSKDTNELLWLTVIAIADQYHNFQITKEKYTSYMVALTADQKRLKNHNENRVQNMSINVLKLSSTFDLDLSLYRQWSILESLSHSPSTFIAFKLWSEKGERKLLKFLGDMGVPLTQAKQSFTYMENEFVEEFKSLFIESIEKHNISNQDSVKTFVANYGYQEEILAQDVVWALNSLLKCHLYKCCLNTKENKDCRGSFFQAYHRLDGVSLQNLMPGFSLAKTMLHGIVKNVRNGLTSREIQQIGSVLYFELSTSNPDISLIAPFIQTFSKLLRDSFIKSLSTSRRQIAVTLPLITIIPTESINNMDKENLENFESQKFLIYGLPPAVQTSCRTIMPRVLRAAAEKCEIDTNNVGFDRSLILIDKSQKEVFVETLTAILLDSL